MATASPGGVSVFPDPLLPPPEGVDVNSKEYRDWFYKLYETLLSNGSTFPKISLQATKKIRSITTEQLDQDEVISVNCGWYSNYTSDSGNIMYGMASNVRRSAGNNLVVGGQFTAYANAGVVGQIMFGGNMAAVGEIGSDCSLVGFEVNAATKTSKSASSKIGIDAVFFNYGAPEGVGGNLYNYHAIAYNVSSQSRSAAGEFCGWNIGYGLSANGLDISLAPAWSATKTYFYGDIISSGGVLWKCILGNNLNNLPPSAAWWVQRSVAVGYGTTNYAVAIDLSGQDATSLSRIWSGIRLTSGMPIHYDDAGTVGAFYDPVNARHVISSTFLGGIPARWLQIEAASGVWWFGSGQTALGGGGGATLGTIGGAGPTGTVQTEWIRLKDFLGNNFWIPIWR